MHSSLVTIAAALALPRRSSVTAPTHRRAPIGAGVWAGVPQELVKASLARLELMAIIDYPITMTKRDPSMTRLSRRGPFTENRTGQGSVPGHPRASSSLTPGRGRSAIVYEELALQRTAFNGLKCGLVLDRKRGASIEYPISLAVYGAWVFPACGVLRLR
jgi:hypothetical protein